jgi:hypothetical protein
MNLSRQLHLYLGVFFAPLIAFLVFTGALDAFHLRTAPPDPFSRPRIWLRTGIKLPAHRLPATDMQLLDAPPNNGRGPEARRDDSRNSFIWLAGLIAAILIAPSVFGLFMSFKRADDWLIFGSLIVLGALLPIGLSFL